MHNPFGTRYDFSIEKPTYFRNQQHIILCGPQRHDLQQQVATFAMASSPIIIFTSISFWIDHSMSTSMLQWIGLYFLLLITSSTSASVSIGGFIYNMVSFLHSPSATQVHPNAGSKSHYRTLHRQHVGSTYMAYDSNNTLCIVYAWCVSFYSLHLYTKSHSRLCLPFIWRYYNCASSSRTNLKSRTTGFKCMASWRPWGKMRVFPETRARYKGNPSCSTACYIRSSMREALSVLDVVSCWCTGTRRRSKRNPV